MQKSNSFSNIGNLPARKVGWALILFVSIVFAAMVFRPESLVHAVEGGKPVNANLEANVVNSGFAELVEAVSPAVISIVATQKNKVDGINYFGLPPDFDAETFRNLDPRMWEFFKRFEPGKQPPSNRPGRQASNTGSGVIINPDGYIVTNLHVVENAETIKITLSDQTEYSAELVGSDRLTDMAVLKIDSETPLPYAEFGNSESARVGDWVIAIGDPFGLAQSVSLGIVSAKGRNLIQNSPNVPLLQIDAAVNKGNSGGPLFNTEGQVIGINTLIFSPTGVNAGVGFAIPSSVVDGISNSLISDGVIRRGWLGVVIQTVTSEIAQALNLSDKPDGQYGALVSEVQANSPADVAGIQPGDLIVEFDGQTIGTVQDLSRLVKKTKPGSEVAINVVRGNESISLNTRIKVLAGADTEMKNAEIDMAENESTNAQFGVTLAELNSDLRSRFGINENVDGVIILDVIPDSPADKSGLRMGDVIKSIERNDTSTVDAVTETFASLRLSEKSRALMLIERGSNSRFIVVDLG